VNSALRLTDIDAFYGDSHVLQKVSLELGEARLLGLLGRNGAGKSTCMNVTVGLLPPRAGSVEVFDTSVTRLPPEMIAARGVALVPQGRRVFKSLTVRENLMVAAHKGYAGQRHAPWTTETVFVMFPRLAERRSQLAGHLSGGACFSWMNRPKGWRRKSSPKSWRPFASSRKAGFPSYWWSRTRNWYSISPMRS
jgi:branched-chain amino acid transport system ATP-binding protein